MQWMPPDTEFWSEREASKQLVPLIRIARNELGSLWGLWNYLQISLEITCYLNMSYVMDDT